MRIHAFLADSSPAAKSFLWARWLFLRALGLIFLSAFYSLIGQMLGLVGSHGILPAATYLTQVSDVLGSVKALWYAPTLLWVSPSDPALMFVVWAGIVASLLLTANVCPRWSAVVATLLFLSVISVLQDFSSYQSDGMLLEAGFVSAFFAPRGIRPGLGAEDPPSRWSRFMLEWEWFRIYFESGVVKLASGDPHWRDLTAMDEYYQNGPLPTWIGWYVQHLPHWYHASTVIITLVVELVLVWAVWLPRPFKLACAAVVTALQVGIITTANYAFLNYLVLALGVLLVDDATLAALGFRAEWTNVFPPSGVCKRVERVVFSVLIYAGAIAFIPAGSGSILGWPARALAPFRIANAYGLFAVMTEARYEIEFQGSRDGVTWTPYPYKYKPQDLRERPGIYAPYQPRFEWNLWFASLGPWQQSQWVVAAQRRLLEGSPDVLRLFRRDPFGGKPPAMVRTVLSQYWFTDIATQRSTGRWWKREDLGLFTGIASEP